MEFTCDVLCALFSSLGLVLLIVVNLNRSIFECCRYLFLHRQQFLLNGRYISYGNCLSKLRWHRLSAMEFSSSFCVNAAVSILRLANDFEMARIFL